MGHQQGTCSVPPSLFIDETQNEHFLTHRLAPSDKKNLQLQLLMRLPSFRIRLQYRILNKETTETEMIINRTLKPIKIQSSNMATQNQLNPVVKTMISSLCVEHNHQHQRLFMDI
jgi:hypothetical protein